MLMTIGAHLSAGSTPSGMLWVFAPSGYFVVNTMFLFNICGKSRKS
jgi:hypothetical protein